MAEESSPTPSSNDPNDQEMLSDVENDVDQSSVNGEEKVVEDPEKKQAKSGVLYFPFIPPKFNPKRLKEYFERQAPGMIGRVYLARNKHSKSIETRYSEGWLEIKRKKLAKQIADTVDNTPIGGKKGDFVSSMLWNIRYLKGFKWVHLSEQLDYEKTVQNKRMAAEVSQARRIAAHFEEQVEKGANLRKLEEKVLKQGGKWEKFQREAKQKKTVKNKKKPSPGQDEVMKMIFAE